MKNWLSKNRWTINWIIFGLLVLTIVMLSILTEKSDWIKDLIQTLTTVSGIYLTVIIFLQTKQESDIQFKEHIEYLQQMNRASIESLNSNTSKQIETFQELTNSQISSFEEQITIVTNRLSDNSILLAEILGRELEKALDYYNSSLENEERRYNNILGFKIGRTNQEREQQIRRQVERIQQIKNGADYLYQKYQQLRNFIGSNKRLNS